MAFSRSSGMRSGPARGRAGMRGRIGISACLLGAVLTLGVAVPRAAWAQQPQAEAPAATPAATPASPAAPDPLDPVAARWAAVQADWPTNATAEVRFAYATALSDAGRYAEAEPHWAALAALVRERNGKGSEADVIVQARWAESFSNLEQDVRARTVAGPGLALALRRFGPDSLHTDRMRLALAAAAMRRGRPDEVVGWLEASFAYNQRAGQTEAARVVGGALAEAYARLNDRPAERSTRLRLAELTTSAGGDEAQELALADRANLAEQQGLFDAAIQLHRERATRMAARLGDMDPGALRARLDLADVLSVAEDWDTADGGEAESLYRAVLALAPPGARLNGPPLRAARALGERLTLTATPGASRFDEGLHLTRLALDAARAEAGPDHPEVQMRMLVLANALFKAGRRDEARALTDEMAQAEARGVVFWQTLGVAALLRSAMAMDEGDAPEAYGQTRRSALAFRDYALAAGDDAETRTTLRRWSMIFRAQVMTAWRAARD
ncbi:hypothetical protein ACO2Q1_16480 [Brevundimonas sp. VNH65]|uniref:hypothetical protein n=1 Tax=Brevundimonas sp. VNH65 TaxID=3400917 RepID=UPI003C125E91